MSYPGPWVQSADYDRVQNEKTPYGKSGTTTSSFTMSAPPYDEEMNYALDAVDAGVDVAYGLQGSVAITSARTDPANGTSEFTAEKGTGGAGWTAQRILDLSYHYSTYLAPNRPATATGIEYEADSATPVGASLHLVTNSGADDSTIPSGQVAGVSASVAVTILAGQTYGTATTRLREFVAPGPIRTDDVDLTPFMGSLGECAIALGVAKLGAWHYYDPSQVGTISVHLSETTGTQMVYTLHPPRHRWLYDTPPPPSGLPPLRQHPRRDGLGASTARRHYPPDRSVQASNRHRGGYY